jgi:hypothetical protein
MQAALEAEMPVPRPGPLPAGRGLQGRPAGFPQRIPGGDRQNHCWAGDLARPGAAGTPRRSRPACSAATSQDQRAGTLVIASFVRGCRSRRRGRPGRALGDQAAISIHGLGHLRQLKDRYQAWARRRLDEVTLDYLFWMQLLPDAGLGRAGAGRQGITTGGKPARSSAWRPAAASPPTPGPASWPT